MMHDNRRTRELMGGAFERTTLSAETVLPLTFVDSMAEVQAKCKPFDIIVEGFHHEDAADADTTEVKPSEEMRPTRRRPRRSSVFSNKDAPTPRVGWAKQALSENTPYSLLRRQDLFERCAYIMDHDDYVWCHANSVTSAFFTDVVTQLERSYAAYLLGSAVGAPPGVVSDSTASTSTTTTTNCITTNDDENKNHGSCQLQQGEYVENTSVCGVCAQLEAVDENDRFLRCKCCGCQAHVYCWFLEQLPSNVDEWHCPSCAVARRVGGMGRCHSCGRRGGVMLPFLLSSECSRQDRRATAPMFCHIVCCLTFKELTIDVERRVVHQVKRVRKNSGTGQCVFCRSNCAGARVNCHHPHCFESMHPSCAQEAGMLECYRLPKSAKKERRWEGCRVYCREHFGIYVDSKLVSARVGDLAEAHALRSLTVSKWLGNKNSSIRSDVTQTAQDQWQSNTTPSASELDAVKQYWVERRRRRLQEGAQVVMDIREGRRDVLSALFLPEIMNVTRTEVRLSRFVCLIPELQHQVNAVVEGVLPIPDEEYDEVQAYRKVHSRTRHAGNTPKLYEKMQGVISHVELFRELADLLHQRAVTRRELLETELELLDAHCFRSSYRT